MELTEITFREIYPFIIGDYSDTIGELAGFLSKSKEHQRHNEQMDE